MVIVVFLVFFGWYELISGILVIWTRSISHLSCVIVWVTVVFRNTAVGDWCFNYLMVVIFWVKWRVIARWWYLCLWSLVTYQGLICLSCVIVRVRVVFRKTVVGDWRFNYLSGSHLQSQVKSLRMSLVLGHLPSLDLLVLCERLGVSSLQKDCCWWLMFRLPGR